MKDITISVVVPCYNCENTIDKCVTSLLRQTSPFYEIILVDDGSVDRTTEIVDYYVSGYKNILSIHKDNGGLVSAWKAGVRKSTGDYVAFCDADDYIDINYVEMLCKYIKNQHADMYLFDIIAEYDDGSTEKMINCLPQGHYEGDELNVIKQTYLFTGKMQSNAILNSRCSKLFCADIIRNCLEEINDELTNGEDAVTTYAVLMNSQSIYCIRDFSPYHYVRNNMSMVGKYDPEWYDKQLFHRNELVRLSSVYHGDNLWQIDNYFYSFVLVYINKEICRSRGKMKQVITNVSDVRERLQTSINISNICTSGYKFGSKVFSNLFMKRKFYALYTLAKIAAFWGYSKG